MFYKALISLVFSLSFLGAASAADEALVVGTKEAPPFVMKNSEGELTGISIDLWRSVAQKMGIESKFVEKDLTGLIQGLQTGELNASMAALTVTSEREAVIDFSHPFYASSLAIATTGQEVGVWSTAKKLISAEFMYAVGALCALLLAVGFLLWFVEHRQNREQFGGSAVEGIGAGFWWAAVTMTTVGYGDKAPTTLLGRIIGFIWMFAAIILISSFTAAIATSLTLGAMEPSVKGYDDLAKSRVITVKNSSSAAFLREEGISFKTADTPTQALEVLNEGRADAVVFDEPLLKYYAAQPGNENVTILPQTFMTQNYAIALPQGSPLRERLNRQLLQFLSTPEWADIQQRYLGSK